MQGDVPDSFVMSLEIMVMIDFAESELRDCLICRINRKLTSGCTALPFVLRSLFSAASFCIGSIFLCEEVHTQREVPGHQY
jgi:hypothetical protein